MFPEKHAEVGFFLFRGYIGLDFLKTRFLLPDFQNGVKIFGMIGADMDTAPGNEGAVYGADESCVNQAATVMSAFRPWVGEVEEERCNGIGRKDCLNSVERFGLD